MVDAAAVEQAVALILQAKHSAEIEFGFGLTEVEVERVRAQVNKENRHINQRLVVVPGIRMEDGPGTLFILVEKKRKGVRG